MNDSLPRLHISRRSGKVRVVAEPGAQVSVEGGSLESRDDGTLEIHSLASSTLVVTCPAGSDLTISTSSGAIEVRGEAGSVRVTTKSGNLAIEHASAIDARGASGRVEVGTCTGECHVVFVSSKVHVDAARRAVIATVSGNIEVDEVDEAEVKTVSGNVELGARGGGRLAARTISGSIKILVPDGDRPTTHLRSVSGRVSCECDDGNDGDITAKTVSGRIKVTCR